MERLIYSLTYPVTTSMLDEFLMIKPHAILDMAQEVASRHAESFHVGTTFCNEHHFGWILVRQEFHVYESPKINSNIEVTTFPHASSRLECKREYIFKCNDKIIARGVAIWVLIDFESRRLQNVSSLYDGYELVEETFFPGKVDKPIAVSTPINETYKVTKSDLDSYHHMNNARYANILFDNVETVPTPYAFSIVYHKEAKLNQIIDLFLEKIEDAIYLTGKTNNEVIFTSRIYQEK